MSYPINVRENRRDNHERTIQKNWQHWAHKTQDDDNHSKNMTHAVSDLTTVHGILIASLGKTSWNLSKSIIGSVTRLIFRFIYVKEDFIVSLGDHKRF